MVAFSGERGGRDGRDGGTICATSLSLTFLFFDGGGEKDECCVGSSILPNSDGCLTDPGLMNLLFLTM